MHKASTSGTSKPSFNQVKINQWCTQSQVVIRSRSTNGTPKPSQNRVNTQISKKDRRLWSI